MIDIFPAHFLDKFSGNNDPKTASTSIDFYDLSGHVDNYHYGKIYVKKKVAGVKNGKMQILGQGRNPLKFGHCHRSAVFMHTNITTIYLYGRRD